MRPRIWLSRTLEAFSHKRWRRSESRLSDEIDAHLDQLADEFVRKGYSEVDARDAALKAFGNLDQVRESHRDGRAWPSLDSVAKDVRFAGRLFVKDRAFTAAAVVALALGIGVNTTVFTMIQGINLRNLPVADAHEIVAIGTIDGTGQSADASYADFVDWRDSARSFAGLAASASASVSIGDENHPTERLLGSFITAEAFDVLGERPIIGRPFNASDDRVGAAPVAVLAHHVWVDRYGSEGAIVGQTVRLNGTPTTIIGVMPPGFRFPAVAEIWQPLHQMPGLTTQPRNSRRVGVFGRLRGEVSIQQARSEMSSIAEGLAARYADTNKSVRAQVIPYTERFVGRVTEPAPLMMMVSVGLVLLISCVNVANLLLARSSYRAREMAMRAALGGSRLRIMRQLLIESLVLAGVSGIGGLIIAWLALPLFVAQTADLGLPYWMRFGFDAEVFLFVAALCIATALVFGLAPAWQLSSAAALEALKEAGRGGSGSTRTRRWTSALVVGELALTIVLLSGAGLLIRSALAMYRLDRLVASDILTTRFTLPATKYPSPAERLAFFRRFEETLTSSPGIEAVSLSSALPFVGAREGLSFMRRPVRLDDTPIDRARQVATIAISAGYFRTLGITLVRGREFSPTDGTAGHQTAVVNELFVATFFDETDPLGRHIIVDDPSGAAVRPTTFTIVGVVPSLRQSPMSDVTAAVYVPLQALPIASVGVMIRGDADRATLTSALRSSLTALDRDVALFSIDTLDHLSDLSRWTPRLLSIVLGGLALIGMLLASLGLYAVTAYSVSQRTTEIGIRMALGARRGQVAWLLLKQTLRLLTIGLLLGLAGAIGAGQLLRGLLVQTRGAEPLILFAVVLCLSVVAAAACVAPLRRATRLDPVNSLRHE